MIMLRTQDFKKINEMLSGFEKELSTFAGVPVTLTMLYTGGEKLSAEEEYRIIERTVHLICKEYNTTKRLLESPSHKEDLPDARKMAYKLLQLQLPTYSLKKLAMIFNRTNHATVIHAIISFEELMVSDRFFAQRYFKLLDQLNVK